MAETQTLSLSKAANAALRVAMESDDRVFLAGEDIGVYGGAFGVTDGLLDEFGESRVRDTPISEEALTGMAVGAAISGLRPVIEYQFSDFIVNAMDPLVNQAAKLHFMYGGHTNVPMVARAPAGGGTGAAEQHSQSLEAWFAHIPGLKVVMPGTAQDYHDLLLASISDANPVIHFEHKGMYKQQGEVAVRESIADTPARLGEAAVRRTGTDVTIVSYSMILGRAMEAADALAERGVSAEVIDLRTLRPLDRETVVSSVRKTGRLVISHESPTSVGVGAEVAASVAGSDALDYLLAPIARVCGRENPMPYAPALEEATIPQASDIEKAAAEVVES